MPTARGITLLAAAGVAWLAARTFGINPLYAVAAGCAAAVACGVGYVRLVTSQVSARRSLDRQRLLAGDRVRTTLELRNDARVPSPTLLVDEQLPPGLRAVGHPVEGGARFVLSGLGPARVAQARYEALAVARGRYRVGPVQVRVRDPLGSAERVRRFSATSEVVVYPRVEPLGGARVRGAHLAAGASDARRLLAAGEEFYTMREYVRGDDLRQVHWPSTAHRQTLMVRQMEQSWQAHATVFVDLRRAAHTLGPDGTLERAVSVAASVVYHLADADYALRLVSDRTVGRAGPADWQAAMEHLATAEASAGVGIGPALAATRGAEGLFVAVVGTPPGSEDPAGHADLRALTTVRGVGQRLALVLDARGDGRAARTAGLLRAAGWQAAALGVADPLAPVWAGLHDPVARRPTAGSGRRP